MMDDGELSWAAGFLEGEGYFGCQRVFSRKNMSGQVVYASNTDLEPLERLRTIFGGHIGPTNTKNSSSKPIRHWHISGASARGVMLMVAPLMSEKRKNEIRASLAGDYKFRRQGIV